MAKKRREINFRPNYLFYWMWYRLGIFKNKINPQTGKKSIPVFVNLGGTRSAKTFSEIQMCYKVLTDMPNAGIRINVYRETLVNCRKYTLIDFKDCFKAMNLEPDVDYTLTGEISGTPQITIKGNIINFLGYPEVGKQAGKCHIAMINEILDSDNAESVDNILQRCEMFAMIDANPAKTVHFIYDRKDWFNWHYSQTTYLDNDYLADGLAGLYESKCTWDFRDSKIMVYDYIPSMPAGWVKDEKGEKLFFNGFRRRVWTKDECPENYIDQPYPNNKYRAPNELNTKNGTADKYWWLTFGEGIPASREGQIFKDIKWIEKFPESGYDHVWFSADWGYTCDNTVLARTGYSKGKNLTIDIMVCEPTRTPEITWIAFKNALAKEEERRKKEGEKNYDSFWICCDSVDSYMGENWVEALNNYAYLEGKNYNFFKISKGSISARVDLLKMFHLTIVDHPRMRIEAINYVYQKINGESTNQPDPHSKFCDCWDAIGYGIWQNGHGLE